MWRGSGAAWALRARAVQAAMAQPSAIRSGFMIAQFSGHIGCGKKKQPGSVVHFPDLHGTAATGRCESFAVRAESAKVSFLVAKTKSGDELRLTVPKSAVKTEGNESYVWRIRDGAAKRVTIVRGGSSHNTSSALYQNAPAVPHGSFAKL